MTRSRGTHEDGTLRIVNVFDAGAERKYEWVPLHGAPALGHELFCSESFGALHAPGECSDADWAAMMAQSHLGVDVLRVEAGESFPLHTHPGHHLLLVVRGAGSVTFGGVEYPTRAGDLYLVDGLVEHAVGATEEHVLLSFGAPHKHVDDPGRMAAIVQKEDTNATEAAASEGHIREGEEG